MAWRAQVALLSCPASRVLPGSTFASASDPDVVALAGWRAAALPARRAAAALTTQLTQGSPLNSARLLNTTTITCSAAAAASSGNGASSDAGAYDYDLFCIGAGSGGVRAARVAAGTYGGLVQGCCCGDAGGSLT